MSGHTALPLIFSATQVSLFRECARKWAFQYVVGIKRPETPAQALGKETEDEQIAPYLTDGREFDDRPSGKIAGPSKPFLPLPRTPGLVLQKHFVIKNDRYAFQGYKDCWLPDSKVLSHLPPFHKTIPVVTDFKTTKSFRYMKTAEILRTDVQAVLYAFDEVVRGDIDVVDLHWVTMQTTPDAPAARFSHVRMHEDHIFEQFETIEKTGDELYQLKTKAPSKDKDEATKLAFTMSLEPNPNMCKEFGGCPFQAQCNLAPKQYREATVERLREQKKEGLIPMANAAEALARLKARKTGTPAPVEAAPAASTAEVPVQLSLMGCADTDVPAPTEIPPVFLGINPPEKSLPPPPAPPVGQAAPTPPPAAEPAAAAKRKGRPPGSKNKPKDEAAPVTEPVGVPEEVPSTESITDGPLEESSDLLIQLVIAETFERFAGELRSHVARAYRSARSGS